MCQKSLHFVCHSGLNKPAPYLIRGNQVFSIWFPAGVHPDENRGRNDKKNKRKQVYTLCTMRYACLPQAGALRYFQKVFSHHIEGNDGSPFSDHPEFTAQ
jgi:hypothetical protein